MKIVLASNNKHKIEDFKFDFKKAGASGGAIYDMDKLTNISKHYLSRLKAQDLYDRVLNWAKTYDNEFYNLISKYKDYTTSILNIEREQKKPRKDFAKYSDVYSGIWYMFDECFDSKELNYDFKNITDKEEIKNILTTYIDKYYNESDDKDTWFNKIKTLCDELGYASDMKAYKENPDNYKGNVADVSTVIRVALTTSSMTPDLYELLKLIGKERIIKRFKKLY